MSELTRWNMWVGATDGEMITSEDGEYVRFADAASELDSLRAEKEYQARELEAVRIGIEQARMVNGLLTQRSERAEAELAACRVDAERWKEYYTHLVDVCCWCEAPSRSQWKFIREKAVDLRNAIGRDTAIAARKEQS